ncbi:MAG: winged helix-turn-helix domain-containing protein [Armatimonadetes bacterium]|nr:winged helix-turn-helix domain-containing protein [Armatimonadota bacterium]
MELGKSLYEQPVSRVTQRVMLNIKSRLTPYDLVLIPKGNTGSEERIKNDIRWARKTLLKHGYLSHYSCHGYWRLTDKGRRYAERLTQRFASEYD